MSAIDAGPARRTRPADQARARPTRRIAPTAAALLALCAILLVGVVFVQIAVIRQNMDRSDLETRAGTVSAQNRDLENADPAGPELARGAGEGAAARHGRIARRRSHIR